MFAYTQLDAVARRSLPVLLNISFGPDRHGKIAYRFRDHVAEDTRFGLAAWDGDLLIGAIQYWPCHVDGAAARLLGPLAVAPAYRGRGAARGLVKRSLRMARRASIDLVVLIGDPALYLRYGFSPAAAQQLTIKGEPDERVQMMILSESGRAASGPVSPAA